MKMSLMGKLRLRFVSFVFVALLAMELLIVGACLFHSYGMITRKADMLVSLILSGSETAETADSRYFIVTRSIRDSSSSCDLSHSVHVTKEEAYSYASEVLSESTEKGYKDEWRYGVEKTKESIKIVFLSRALQLESFKSYAFSLAIISLAGILLMTLFAVAVSKKVVSPLVRNREKQKEFITSASHNLKTPLTVISADAQLLEMESGSNEWLDDIIRETKKMTEMTQRLVFLSKAEEQSEESVMIEFPISDVSEEIALSFRAVAKESERTYSYNIAEGISFRGDENAFRELMTALLDNAFKYSDEKGSVSLSLSRKGRYVSLIVENTAPESALKSVEHFTKRFYRSDTSDRTKGFGIGLSVAEAVCRKHSGKLLVERSGNNSIKITALLKW